MKYFLLILLFLAHAFSYAQRNAYNSNIKIIEILTSYSLGSEILRTKVDDVSLIFFKSGLNTAISIENDSLIATGNYYIGDFYFKKKDYALSFEYFNSACAIYKSLNDYSKISNCLNGLSRISREKSDFEKALFYQLESLEINEQSDNDIGVAEDLNEIGLIYSLALDYESAILYLNRALKLNQKNKYKEGIVKSISILGAVNERTGKFNNAILYYNEALELAVEVYLRKEESVLLGNIGSTLRSLGKYNESLRYLFEALKLKKELSHYGGAAQTCNDISETYMKMDQFEDAKEYALQAIEYAKNENLEQERSAHLLVAQSYYSLEDYKNAYEQRIIYGELNDSVFHINRAASINDLGIKYETKKRELKIQTQESNIALLDEKNKVKNQWLSFGGLGLLLGFGFVVLYRSRNASKKRVHLQQQFSVDLIIAQEAERTRVSKELHDSVGQQLTLIKKKAQNLNQDELSHLTNIALEELRSISRGLYPANLEQLGLSESIEQLLFDLDEETNMFFSVDIDDINDVLDKDKTLNFYRFIQESLNNVLKHSEASVLSITIKRGEDYVIAVIEDNGRGFEEVIALKQNSVGLKTMVQRIRILKGTLSIVSRKEIGTIVTARIPI